MFYFNDADVYEFIYLFLYFILYILYFKFSFLTNTLVIKFYLNNNRPKFLQKLFEFESTKYFDF